MNAMYRLLAIFALCCSARAATYYIATTGNDSNPGSLGSPFLTVQKGVNTAVAGDTIIVQDGTYGGNGCNSATSAANINTAGTMANPITLKAAHKGMAILDSQNTCNGYINFQASSAWWVIQDFDIRNGFWGGINCNAGGCSNIVIKGNVIHDIGRHSQTGTIGITGIYTDSSATMTVSGNIFHDIGRFSVAEGGVDPGNSYDHSIYSHGNLTIVNNIFYRSLEGWHIQTAIGFQGLIANNTFYGPNMYAGSAKNGQIVIWDVQGGAVTIRNNIFSGPNGSAVVTVAATTAGCNIDHNISTTSSAFDTGATCTVASNLLSTNPLLVNPGSNDFQLQSSSPAIDAGVTISAASPDFNSASRPIGSAYDIGAYERLADSNALSAFGQTNIPTPAVVAPRADHTVSAQFLLSDTETVPIRAGFIAPSSITGTDIVVTSATGANPMVLTLASGPQFGVKKGTAVVLSGMAGTGCTAANGQRIVSAISGTAVTITYNGTGCAYTGSSGKLIANLLWQLPASDSIGCLQSNGSGVLALSHCTPTVVDQGIPFGNSMGDLVTDVGHLSWVDSTHTLSADNINSSGTIAAFTAMGVSGTGQVNLTSNGQIFMTGAGTEITLTQSGSTTNLGAGGAIFSTAGTTTTISSTDVTIIGGGHSIDLAAGAITINGISGITKACTALPVVVAGIVTLC